MQVRTRPDPKSLVLCYHCGAECLRVIEQDSQSFCCEGCRLVYDLLKENNLCTYYTIDDKPGLPVDSSRDNQFEILDRPEILRRFLRFESKDRSRILFRVENMHCSSCIWLLEHLPKLDAGVIKSEVNFPAREVTIDYSPDKTTPSRIALLLSRIGYAPALNLQDLETQKERRFDPRVIKIGVAGFCFGNIMMLSFPEYLGAEGDQMLVYVFGWISLALSIPALVYCASGFFQSAWKTLRYGTLNIDGPIALAIAVTFGRSVYAVITGDEAHYLDSMTGIIFFMLLGRYFQDRTYERLNFERDYKSYFPIAVTLKSEAGEKNVPVTSLGKGDHIVIRANELIPADAVLLSERTYIDYSFVSGESAPVACTKGETVYAGGRLTGSAAEFIVSVPVSAGYLTKLWNGDPISKRNTMNRETYLERISKWFSLSLLITAFIGAGIWFFIDKSVSLNVLTAVLIVACPCTLLLASTFTNGSVLRWLGRAKFYLRNADAIDRIATSDTIVFDKTGTITHTGSTQVKYEGDSLTEAEWNAVISLARQSGHPLSGAIAKEFAARETVPLSGVQEVRGSGITGNSENTNFLLGSASYAHASVAGEKNSSEVWVAVNGKPRGRFLIRHRVREGLNELTGQLKKRFEVSLLSGDNASSREMFKDIFGSEQYFERSPAEKLEYINELKSQGKKVLMIGDGLNDSGALMAADAGIAVSDNTNNYFPASDAILDGSVFSQLDKLIAFTRSASRVVKMTFVISLLYNFVGLYYSLTGQLSPLIAAVLMPASSFTVIIFTTLAVRFSAQRHLKDLIV